jgi:hypothetical protein
MRERIEAESRKWEEEWDQHALPLFLSLLAPL